MHSSWNGNYSIYTHIHTYTHTEKKNCLNSIMAISKLQQFFPHKYIFRHNFYPKTKIKKSFITSNFSYLFLFYLCSFTLTCNKLFKFISKVRKMDTKVWQLGQKKLYLGKQPWYFKAKYFQASLKSSTEYPHLLAPDPSKGTSYFLIKTGWSSRLKSVGTSTGQNASPAFPKSRSGPPVEASQLTAATVRPELQLRFLGLNTKTQCL